jgi:hypothetical protein
MSNKDEPGELTAPGTADLQEWLAQCDPKTPLELGDERYLDLGHALDDQRLGLRGQYSVDRLLDPIDLEKDSSCQLFTGFPGTGKSTELRRLAHLLEEQGYSVLLVGAEDYLNLEETLAIVDLLIVVASAFGDATDKRLKKDVTSETYMRRLLDFLKTDIAISEAKLPVDVLELKVGIGHSRPFWLEVRKTLASSLGKLADNAHNFVRRCVSEIRDAEPQTQGVVFIVDNLERLSPILSRQFSEVMESVVRTFSRHSSLLRLPGCHVVYTVPPYVQMVSPRLNDHYDGRSFLLPAVKVCEPGLPLRPYAPGIDAFVEIVKRRLPVDRIFGDREDLLEKLVLYSGGHVRTLISFLKDLIYEGRHGGIPPTEDVIERIVQPFRSKARNKMGRQGPFLLDAVERRGTLEDVDKEDHAELASFMQDYLVLCYLNGDDRYEIHPLIRETVQERLELLTADKKRQNAT